MGYIIGEVSGPWYLLLRLLLPGGSEVSVLPWTDWAMQFCLHDSYRLTTTQKQQGQVTMG